MTSVFVFAMAALFSTFFIGVDSILSWAVRWVLQ